MCGLTVRERMYQPHHHHRGAHHHGAPYRHPPGVPEDFTENIVDIDVSQEMQGSFLEYAYSVIYAAPCRTRATASSRSSAGSSTRCPTWGCARTART